jgi:DNA-binding CsgD family transcriptional regulator
MGGAMTDVKPGDLLGKPLTLRERDLLTKIAAGHDNARIARDLFLSIHTVKSQIRILYRKLGVHSAAHAVALGYQRGLINDETGAVIARLRQAKPAGYRLAVIPWEEAGGAL